MKIFFFVPAPLVKNNCRPRLLRVCTSKQRINQANHSLILSVLHNVAKFCSSTLVCIVLPRLSSGK